MAEETTPTPQKAQAPRSGGRPTGGPRTGGRSGGRRPERQGFERARPEFEQKILSIRRVTRVVAGGRRMSFAVSMAIGDKKGSIGLGTGKAGDTALAIAKAMRNARKSLLRLKLNKKFSLPYDISAKYGSSRVMLRPNNGKGLVSGSSARDMLILAGIKDVTSKYSSGTKNKLNNARAVMKALEQIAQPYGVKVETSKEKEVEVKE